MSATKGSRAPWLGVVADDLTGACDLADAVSAEGLATVVRLGVPQEPAAAGDCAVVALKSRTAPAATAVEQSVAAAHALHAAGCRLLYQKYCSTFDSTDRGNIGPVADALCAVVGGDAVSVGTPATPRVGRTVYQGHLFVGRQLLSESPMRDHPLTPMRDSDLVAVLGRQSGAAVSGIALPSLAGGPDTVVAAIDAARRDGARHVLLDALTDTDLDVGAEAVRRLFAAGAAVLTGGAAGFAAALARTGPGTGPGRPARARPATTDRVARRLIVSGSCSARTREQVEHFAGPRLTVSPLELAADPNGTVARLCADLVTAFETSAGPVLVSSSADPSTVARFDAELGSGRASRLLEAASGTIAAHAVARLGVAQLVVAGGETSGAVAHALGVGTLQVGPQVGPGLAWMVPVAAGAPLLLFKSGNFGAPDLFTTAWEVL